MTTTENPIKKEYLQLLRKMKKQFILAIDNYIKTIKSDEMKKGEMMK